MSKYGDVAGRAILLALTAVILMFSIFVYNFVKYVYPHEMDVQAIKENIDDYTVFYNGEEIDGSKVALDDYAVSYDLDKKEVYLAPKAVKTNVPIVGVTPAAVIH